MFSYLDFLPFLRSVYVVDISISKRQRLSFPRKICASHYPLTLYSQEERIYRNHKELGSHSLSSSSFLSPKGLQIVPCLPHCRNNAELLQHPQLVKLHPAFHDLAATDTHDLNPCDGHWLTGWGNALKLPLVGSLGGEAGHDLVSFGDHVILGDP